MHTVMQHLPFKEAGLTDQALNDYIESLVERSIIRAHDVNVIVIEEIKRFIQSDLYDRIAK